MALATSLSVGLLGIEGSLVKVEADLAQGVPMLSITGLPDASLNEARDRMRAAIANSGESWPSTRRITIGLSPASVPKRGSGFDLAMAAAVLAADGVVPVSSLIGRVLLGELGLDGSVRAVRGVLPAVLAAQKAGIGDVVVPLANLAEAQLVDGMSCHGISCLRSLLDLLRGKPWDERPPALPVAAVSQELAPDYLDVLGQPVGRLACEVAAAGGHNVLMVGPPGCGKTLLAQRMPGILPPLSIEEALEVTAIHSVADTLPSDVPLLSRPPFQDPHHGSSMVSLIGGGGGIAKPGAASLAHRGVLFLDEAPEFAKGSLDALRQPLESGSISIRRVGGTATYPARFSLLLAANPCPCAKPGNACTCSPERRRSYLGKLSGPLLDRMDITVVLPAITRQDILSERSLGDSTSVIAERVRTARERATLRLAGTPWRTNSDVPATAQARLWPIRKDALHEAGRCLDRGMLTARGLGRVQRLAWTLADLAGLPEPTKDQVGGALMLRLGEDAVLRAA